MIRRVVRIYTAKEVPDKGKNIVVWNATRNVGFNSFAVRSARYDHKTHTFFDHFMSITPAFWCYEDDLQYFDDFED